MPVNMPRGLGGMCSDQYCTSMNFLCIEDMMASVILVVDDCFSLM